MPEAGAAGDPDDEAVVRAAVDAAEAVIFDAYSRSDIADVDVTVHFEGGELSVDVYLNVPDDRAVEEVADDAARAAQAAVDDLLAA